MQQQCPEIKKIKDPDLLEAIVETIKVAKNLDEIRAMYK